MGATAGGEGVRGWGLVLIASSEGERVDSGRARGVKSREEAERERLPGRAAVVVVGGERPRVAEASDTGLIDQRPTCQR